MTLTAVPTSPETTRGPSRWFKVALIASVALNLMFLGAAASAMWRFRHGPPFAVSAVNANLLSFTARLPHERRQLLWRLTDNERRALRPLRFEVRSARQLAQAALIAEPFDPDRFTKAQAALVDAEIRARTEAQKLFNAVATALTPDERLAFARWQAANGPRRPSGKGRWWQHDAGGKEEPVDSPR